MALPPSEATRGTAGEHAPPLGVPPEPRTQVLERSRARRVGRRASRWQQGAAVAVAVVAATIAIWPLWVNDGGVRIKCGFPVITSELDYADGGCRQAGQRHLLISIGVAFLGAVTTLLVDVAGQSWPPSVATGDARPRTY